MTTAAGAAFNLRRSMILVTFALPQESRDFRRRLANPQCVPSAGRTLILGKIADTELAILHTGVGGASASAAIKTALATLSPRIVISSGFAGGLQGKLRLGDLILATNVSHAELLAQSRAASGRFRTFYGGLISSPHAVESVEEKAALACSSGAVAVDMETASLAAACAAAGVPFLSARAISDTAQQALPIPFAACFDLLRQRPRPFSVLCFLARHPQRILPFARFVRGLGAASAALSEFLIFFLSGENKCSYDSSR